MKKGLKVFSRLNLQILYFIDLTLLADRRLDLLVMDRGGGPDLAPPLWYLSPEVSKSSVLSMNFDAYV